MGEENNILSESETSLLLDTYMYLDYYGARDGQKLKDILQDLSGLPDYRLEGKHSGEYEILKKAVERAPELGELQISAQSFQFGFDSGTRACLFQEKSTQTVYVVYRGTGDGEWMDNGLGMNLTATLQQRRAVSYFETAMDEGGFTERDRIIITGHSKGGNKAQYVTMETEYGNLIDRCYSVDGQGFSNMAIDKWMKKYSQSEYDLRTGKLYGINGENDFVNVLGYSIIPKDHIRYLHTPVKENNFAGYHDIKYMFADEGKDGKLIFTGQSNYLTGKQKEWGIFARKLSDEIMRLAPQERAGCAAVMMQLMELGGKKKTGLNGEKVTLSNWLDFFQVGLPTIAAALLFSEEGGGLTRSFFQGEMGKGVFYAVNPLYLARQAEKLEQVAFKVNQIAVETEAVADKLKESMKYGFPYSFGICGKIKTEKENLQKEARQLKKMAEVLDGVAQTYAVCEERIVCI